MDKLFSELKTIITEFDFTHRWSEIEKWWTIGKELCDPKWEITTKQIREIADYMEIEPDELYDAIIFYKKYPDLDTLPVGKNWSWERIKEELL